MKKFFQSKGFIVSVLVVLCVAILGVCWLVSRDRTENFKPDESPPSSTTSDWSDGGAQNGDDSGGVDAYSPGQSPSSEEEYPKVTSETESEVVIDFTDTDKPEELYQIYHAMIRGENYKAETLEVLMEEGQPVIVPPGYDIFFFHEI